MARRTQRWKSLLTPQHHVLIGKDAKHTERLAAQAASDQVSSLTIVGGDGTLHHALNGYLSVPHTTTRLCIIPSGSANDYAASLNTHAFSTGNRRLTVDVGILSYPNFQRFFLNVAGIGLNAHTAISSRPARWLPARLRYTRGLLRTLISGWRYMDTWIEMQDQRIRQQHLLTLSVAIGTREGSFLLDPKLSSTMAISTSCWYPALSVMMSCAICLDCSWVNFPSAILAFSIGSPRD